MLPGSPELPTNAFITLTCSPLSLSCFKLFEIQLRGRVDAIRREIFARRVLFRLQPILEKHADRC
jgi:hypothetical protein